MHEPLDFFLMMALGFLGSFGHCVGMCGPLAVALSLSQSAAAGPRNRWRSLRFHGLLNGGRILSYTLVGAGIGGLGSVLVVGGQLAGIDSTLRHWLTVGTGSLLIWMGLAQVIPTLLPKLPVLHPLLSAGLHQRLHQVMMHLSSRSPLLLGMCWGLIPCGFLYAAQLKAAATSDLWQGAIALFGFGLGTLPAMLGIGLSGSWLSRDRRTQLFRMGGWVMLATGLLTLLRTSEMTDYTGHAALILLMLALVARPCARLVPWLLTYRRALGVGAFILAIAHTSHMMAHAFDWSWGAIAYLLVPQQWGAGAGILALLLLTPAAVTSTDGWKQRLGRYWSWIHLLTLPAFGCAVLHTILLGSHYLGRLDGTLTNQICTGLLLGISLGVVLVRWQRTWMVLALERFYGSPQHSTQSPQD